MAKLEGVRSYRDGLARKLTWLRGTQSISTANETLNDERSRSPYQVARIIRKKPDALSVPIDGEVRDKKRKGAERGFFRFYKSNEFYKGVASELKNLGGVGLAVGSDQALDFMTMGNLEEVFAVDIDDNTHVVTRGYLEIGARLHKIYGRYPTTEEFTALFDPINLGITKDILELPSTTHKFSRDEIRWFIRNIPMQKLDTYLKQKRKVYGTDTWIGSDRNLANIISAYERGNIHICQGSIVGEIIPRIAKELKKRKKQVSFIYTSNAPVRSDESLQRWSILPFAKNAKVVSSTRDRDLHQFRGVPLPENFPVGLFSWSFVVFSPQLAEWPALYLRKEFFEISPGIYRYSPNK